MKKLITVLTLIVILSGVSSAQPGWFSIYSCDTIGLQSVYFTSASTGYAVGVGMPGYDGCMILKTTSAGMSWLEQTSPHRDSIGFWFRSVFFTDMNTGYIASFHQYQNIGRIIKTTNGGSTWSIIFLPIETRVSVVNFINSSTGFACGDEYIFKTANAGANWTAQKLINTYVSAIDFTDVNIGYAVGSTDGEIFKSTNAGENWTQKTSCGIPLWGVDFCNSNTGIAVGGYYTNNQNIILRTTNAGENWETLIYAYSACLLHSVRFVNSSTGWITGFCGLILKTTNAGLNWFNQSATSNDFRASYFLDVNTGYAVAGLGGYCRIVKTTDGGGPPIGINPASSEVPLTFSLAQNYPNPFNPVTKIKFDLPKSSHVKLSIYDVLGRDVVVLVNEKLNAGTYEVEWNASNLPSGVYFYKLTAGSFTETRKMILIK